MKPNKNESQNQNSHNKEVNSSKKFTPTLLFSGFFIAVSFITQIIPLAVFNVAQISAILGKRKAVLLMIAVALVLILIGSAFAPTILATGILVLLAIPFFMSAVMIREKNKHWLFAAVIMFLPTLFLFYTAIFVADKKEFAQQMGENIGLVQQEKSASSQDKSMQNFSASEKINNPDTNIAEKTNKASNPKSPDVKAFYENFEKGNPGLIKYVTDFLNYSSWQRILFFVFGSGSIFLLLCLLISFANVVFVDFGFEQIERLRSIVNYILRNSSSFTSQLVNSLLAMPMVNTGRTSTPIMIEKHKLLNSEDSDKKDSSILAYFWKPLKPKNSMFWQGYAFRFQGQSSWNLREFTLPFPLVIASIAGLASIGLSFTNFETMLKVLEHSSYAPLIAGISLFSFILLTIVALQGMFTLYKRLTTIALFPIVLIFALLLVNKFIGTYEIIGFFGVIGLLDYVYDWRGISKKQS
ncbi:hypothetical protein QEJ31_02240 [Pigmentibacter sp. JX0631]|uniref:hypothetical protein n=1 Tax=Pigmentibacter sp. JX0631 TaxID=2976982 RepID=UPI0024683F79|nr:hypothetical protein [Pigmentibacter sp. JX0631]WGL60424.1 hypothetical protein QEJ31_02240 [Pigmentibacter sp. JX0631]